MDKAAMLSAMARMQDEHNQLVHPRWREQGYEFYRAIWVECAELLDHFGWKWWKHQEGDQAQVKLELVDIWHFGLSDLMRRDALASNLVEVLDVQPAAAVGGEALRQAVEALAAACLTNRAFAADRFAEAMAALPLSFDELFRLYVGKNVLNRFRQAQGYKTGTYLKLWQGREDNEHLMELLEELDAPETAADDLYAKLQARYSEAAPTEGVVASPDPSQLAKLRRRLADWTPERVGTLMFIRDGERLLLIRKKRGHGAGRINAPGGKVEPDETPLQCAVRETQEEIGVQVLEARRMAELKFVEQADEQWLGHVFLASKCAGVPTETGEATPQWFPIDAIPYDQMWEDDRLWLPQVLAGRFVRGAFLFEAGALVAHEFAWTLAQDSD